MKDLYVPQEFVHQINLRPQEINRRLMSTLQTRVVKELSGRCIRGIGHIKPGSVQIVKTSLGKYVGAHLTGNMTFDVTVRCMAAQPIAGKTIICSVIAKNEAGVVGRNFTMPYVMFVPRIEGDDDDLRLIDSLKIDSTIEVVIKDFVLKPPNKDRPYPEYWIICKIKEVELETTRLSTLPSAMDLPSPDTWIFVKGAAKAYDRQELTGKQYDQLETVKNMLDTHINKAYAEKLMRMSRPEDDFLIKSTSNGKADFIGIMLDDSIQDDSDYTYNLHIIKSNVPQYRAGSEYQIKAKRPADKNEVVISEKHRDFTRLRTFSLWDAHVRYIMNKYETVRPNSTYDAQIGYLSRALHDTSLLPAKPDKTVSRAYYKMYELLAISNSFERPVLPMAERPLRVLCIAESPGGFLQALMQYRRAKRLLGECGKYPDEFVGMSINPGSVRGDSVWGTDLVDYVKDKEDIIMAESSVDDAAARMKLELIGDEGADLPREPGNLFMKESREGLVKGDEMYVGYKHRSYLSAGADLVTADGGAEHDKRENMQEIESHKLILAEVVTAMRCQRVGGTFVLKIFDITTNFSANMVTVLCSQYNHSYIYKPKASRAANSEKYLICQGYAPQEGVVEALTDILDGWTDDSYVDSIFENPKEIIEAITHYNSAYMQRQIDFLKSSLDYADSYIFSMDTGGNAELMQAKLLAQNIGLESFFNTKVLNRHVDEHWT